MSDRCDAPNKWQDISVIDHSEPKTLGEIENAGQAIHNKSL